MIITSALMTFGAGFATAAITKAEGPGRALDDIMTLVGFERLHEVAEMKRAKTDNNVQMYKESIAQKVAAIPEENLQEPPLSIVGPALEASKYYIEEEVLREMFSNLISSSMNSTKDDSVHTSYVEIIKQLNTHDANILINFKKLKLAPASLYPIMKMKHNNEDGSFKNIFPLMVLFNDGVPFFKNTPSINNLERLGLIKTTFGTYLSKESSYDFIKNNSVVKEVLNDNPTFSLDKGSLTLTEYGANFINICVE